MAEPISHDFMAVTESAALRSSAMGQDEVFHTSATDATQQYVTVFPRKNNGTGNDKFELTFELLRCCICAPPASICESGVMERTMLLELVVLIIL